MRSLLKTLFSGTFITLIITKWDLLVGFFNVQNAFSEDSDLLIKLGGMIGYTIFIVFAFIVQGSQIRNLIHINKQKGMILNIAFIVLTILFLAYIAIDFTLQVALINLMLYLLVVSIFDFIGERVMLTTKAHKSHPKTII